MVNEKAIHTFLQAVWRKAQETGWPVNANEIGMDLFGDDLESVKKSTRNVIGACQDAGYFKATLDGDIHQLSDSAKALLNVDVGD